MGWRDQQIGVDVTRCPVGEGQPGCMSWLDATGARSIGTVVIDSEPYVEPPTVSWPDVPGVFYAP